MSRAWNGWLKFLAAAILIVGCNVFAPAMAASSKVPAMSNMGDCHQSGQADGLSFSICTTGCLALPADLSGPAPAVTLPTICGPAPVAALLGQPTAPDTPPPRIAV